MNATPAPRTDTKITFTGAFTCAHHNDQQRAACPVCLVSALTAERDHWQEIAKTMSAEREHNANVAQEMTAERDQLRVARAEKAEAELAAAKERLRSEAMDDYASIKHLQRELTTLTAELTVALTNWNGALERALKAEADLAALEQCHDDNCRAVVKIDAELAAERARLDWLESPSGMDWQWEPTRLTVSRASIDAAIKEGAK